MTGEGNSIPKETRNLASSISTLVTGEQKRLPTKIVHGLLEKAKAKVEDLVGRKSKVDVQTVANLLEKYKHKTDTRDTASNVLTGYLGNYDPESCTFTTGGVEAIAENGLEGTKKILRTLRERDVVGYKDFWEIVEKTGTLATAMRLVDKNFAEINTQHGLDYVDLEKLDSKEKRVAWFCQTFLGLTEKEIDANDSKIRREIEGLWNEAYLVRTKLKTDPREGKNSWKDFSGKWKKTVSHTDQIAILGFLQITQSQGIDNFFAGTKELRNEQGRIISACSLGGSKQREISQQYVEAVTAFLETNSRRGRVMVYEPGRGIAIDNLSLRDRAVLRATTDFFNVSKEEGDAGITRFLIERGRPKIEGSVNPWDEIVARAEFETAYKRYDEQVNVKQVYNEARFKEAAFNEVASARIVKEHWFGMIFGFKEAVAKFTTDSGDHKSLFDKMMASAREQKDIILIKRLEDAQRYARQYLEMSAAQIGGLHEKKDFTLTQVIDPTVSSRSGPIKERVRDEGMEDFREKLARAVEKKTYHHKERVNKSTNRKEIVIYGISGINGEIIVPLRDRKVLELAEAGGTVFFAHIFEHGQYKENGYWANWEETVGSGFSAYLRDAIEQASGYLTRTNLAMYQKREIGRRCGGELYDGSDLHKRFFVQFLLERRQALKGGNWEETFQQETGVPFDPLNNYHLTILANKLGIRIEGAQPDILTALANPQDPDGWGVSEPDGYMEKLVAELANPDKFELYFDPLNESHMAKLYSNSAEVGFDRFYKTVLWAFEGMTALRDKSKTLFEMITNGATYSENEGWTGATAEELMKFASEEWKQCRADETLQVLEHLIQRLNEAYTEEVIERINVRNTDITDKSLDELFRHHTWKVAQLTSEEKQMVLETRRLYGEDIVLINEEIQEGQTVLGKAMTLKGKRMRLNIYTALYQSMYMDMVAMPSVPLDQIWALRIQKGWFNKCVPNLSKGELTRTRDNPVVFALLPFDDIATFDFIENDDPRYEEMLDDVLGALIIPASMAIDDQIMINSVNTRQVEYKLHQQAARQGYWIDRVRERMGLEDFIAPNIQFGQQERRVQNLKWIEMRGRYVGLPLAVKVFARDHYDLDITDVEAVRKLGGKQFLDQFTEIVSDTRRLLHVNYGIPGDSRSWPADYEQWYKWTLGPLAGPYNEATSPENYQKRAPEWWNNIPPIIITEGEDSREVKPAINYKSALRILHQKNLREPLFGPWPRFPAPHIQRDYKAIHEISFLDCREENGRLKVALGAQLVGVINAMQQLADLPEKAVLPTAVEENLMPQLEQYALNCIRTIDVDGKRVVLNETNVSTYRPQIIREFKRRIEENGPSKRGNYNLEFIDQFLLFTYGLNLGDVELKVARGVETTLKVNEARELNVSFRGRSRTFSVPERNIQVSAGSLGLRRTNAPVSIETYKRAIEFQYGIATGQQIDSVNIYLAGLRNVSDDLRNPAQEEDPDCIQGNSRILYRWRLESLREKLQYSIEGPSVLFRAIQIAQQRNWGYYKDYILERRMRWVGMSNSEKKALFNKLKEMADPENPIINDEAGIAKVKEMHEDLKKLGFNFNSPGELAVFVGNLDTKHLEDLRKILFTRSPWELQKYIAPDKIIEQWGWAKAISAIRNKEFGKFFRKAYPKEGVEFVAKEFFRGIYYSQRYSPAIFPRFPLVPILEFFQLKGLAKVITGFERTIFGPKVSAQYAVIGYGLYSILTNSAQRVSLGTDIFQKAATALQVLAKDIPTAATNLKTYTDFFSNFGLEPVLLFFGTGFALNLINEVVIPLFSKRAREASSITEVLPEDQ